MFTTNDVICKKLGIEFNQEELSSFPQGQKFCEAPEVAEIASQLINLFRGDIMNLNIAYVFKEKASKSKEGTILGQAKRENDLEKVLHGYDSVVIIAWDKWITMDKDQKARVVMHELEHIQINPEKGTVEMADHPINEFPSVIKVFGPGQESDVDFINAYQAFVKENSTLIDEINNQRGANFE